MSVSGVVAIIAMLANGTRARSAPTLTQDNTRTSGMTTTRVWKRECFFLTYTGQAGVPHSGIRLPNRSKQGEKMELECLRLRKYRCPRLDENGQVPLMFNYMDVIFLHQIGPIYRVTWYIYEREGQGETSFRPHMDNEAFFDNLDKAFEQYKEWCRWRYHSYDEEYETNDDL